MGWASLIRRIHSGPRRHFHDAVLVALFMAALAAGAHSISSGIDTIAQTLPPQARTMHAQVAETSDHASLALSGLGGIVQPYTPQVLFPDQIQSVPDWLARAAAGTPLPPRPVVAICIDDLGEDLAGTDRAIALPRNVTLSFLPFAEGTPFLAREAERAGHQVLAHVPMEAIANNPGPMSLKVGSPDIAARLLWNLARVPGLSGINNHEGSKFSTDAASLIPVMQVLAPRHLFYFDSRTIAGSQGIRVARRFGVMSAGRDIFLDDTLNDDAIRQALVDLAAEARRSGVAIAIGHPHDQTLTILSAWLAQDHGVTLVPVSDAILLKNERQVAAAE